MKTMIAVLVLQAGVAAAGEAQREVPQHLVPTIQVAVNTAGSGAVVTVAGVEGQSVRLRVAEKVMGSLPAEVRVPTRTFAHRDLTPGTCLLVFFRHEEGNLVATKRYELVVDGKIRDIESDVYLARTRYEAARTVKERHARAKLRKTSPLAAIVAQRG